MSGPFRVAELSNPCRGKGSFSGTGPQALVAMRLHSKFRDV
jgi:hypothetical protein